LTCCASFAVNRLASLLVNVRWKKAPHPAEPDEIGCWWCRPGALCRDDLSVTAADSSTIFLPAV
ncbi:MAG: hypothetical protein J2P17_26945, partial [Mycobacterium sp.]|nr:hypothetical protein [Mycobacterium sp.]